MRSRFCFPASYDYIVVGAGSAGSVLAAELASSGTQVLVIESGGNDDAPTILNPSIWFYNLGSALDYDLPINPNPRLDNRRLNIALGHVLGGGSSINALVWGRGMQRDFDGYAQDSCLRGAALRYGDARIDRVRTCDRAASACIHGVLERLSATASLVSENASRAAMSIYHPIDDADMAAVSELRKAVAKTTKPQFAPENRGTYDDVTHRTRMPSGINFEEDVVGGVWGYWCRPQSAGGSSALLFLHGGGYVMGSPGAYRGLAGQIVARSKIAAFIPDYRLAPEHPFPAAIEDAVAVYGGLSSLGFASIGISGDSSGGGLALALLTYLTFTADRGDIGPCGAAVFSPMTDLALTVQVSQASPTRIQFSAATRWRRRPPCI